jgi:hypothetical protein
LWWVLRFLERQSRKFWIHLRVCSYLANLCENVTLTHFRNPRVL